MNSGAKEHEHIQGPVGPVLGMILKGYPRISETFISNEILLLEKLGFAIHLFSMRQPRENFTPRKCKKNPGKSGLSARNTDKAFAAAAVSQPLSGCQKSRWFMPEL